MINLHMMQSESSHVSPSPSFSSYSSETLAEIAARVIREFGSDPASHSDDSVFASWQPDVDDNRSDLHQKTADGDVHGEDDDDFEFAFVCRDPHSSPVSADDIFYNGQIRPMYPIFDRSLLDGVSSVSLTQNTDETEAVGRRRLPLRKLMFEERETGSCSSSTSEAEDIDLEGVAPGTYCVWDPKSSSASFRRPCKKSSSTGSASKRWKFRDLLPRSHSDGKVPLVIFTTNNKSNKVAHEASKPEKASQNSRAVAPAKEEDESKRKQPLPYRQEFIGLFTNVNGLGRNLRPF
ncbi:uncharacterized protein LOC129320713 [Prosopis cineraria]|uniref:uncharacterized protein LOC129320713 n=1 Tax=Prosopis cineraria TaxID=364024 RepID=UPI00240EC9C8|nr:uncharacterized protein LOC129320713 [Prosopis cineraria]